LIAQPEYDAVVVGGGIVGLATARALAAGGRRVAVVEKEAALAQHQTARNSGVVHAGLYYAPGSLKATLCTDGRARMADYCRERNLPYDECGKLVVAVSDDELDGLREILRRAQANGVPEIRWLDAAGLRDVEPHARGVAAVHSPRTAITDFAAVARSFADDVRRSGGHVLTGFEVTALDQDADRVLVRSQDGRALSASTVVTCAGLWSDRVAVLSGDGPEPSVLPFRGDYYSLRGDARRLVHGLIYPVPDPRYPFLGVHLTRTVDGDVLVGPNAVLQARARELPGLLRRPGFRKLAREHWRTGAAELLRARSRRAFAATARRYVPALQPSDMARAPAGVRAQCVSADGELLQDFVISTVGRVVNVRNAPSPAATSSLAIADEVAARVTYR
jgi:L-2-hydroxyglutarate oxidase LhgO